MKRSRKFLTVACAALLLCVSGARADTTKSGSVAFPSSTPSLARALYQANPDSNGGFGYVLSLPAAAAGSTYTLRRTAGMTERENLDAWFYEDLSKPNPRSCRAKLTTDTGNIESGSICTPGGPVAAVIIVIWLGPDESYGLSGGANARFTFTY